MEVKLDKSTLPMHKQEVRFQTVIDEDYGTWKEGIYNAKEESIYTNEAIYDMWGDIVRWETV